MKVKRFIITCGVLVSTTLFTTLFVLNSAYATLTYEKSSDIQFTFEPILSLTLTGATTDCGITSGNASYCINNLAPGNTDISNVVNALVSSNNAAGWTLSATVGGTSKEDSSHTYASTDLELSGGSGSSTDSFTMISAGATALTNPGDWGFTIDGGTTYMNLPAYDDASNPARIINQTVDAAGNPATGYTGDTSDDGTDTQIGAYAKAAQISGTYGNVINFTAITNIPARQVTLVPGTNVASVTLGDSSSILTKSFAEGETIGISATCDTGYDFAGWGLSPEFGSLTNRNAASTDFTVGPNDVTITAYCGYNVMQNFSAAGMSTGDTAVVVDARDGNRYTVAKLPDGKVWMTQNLTIGCNGNTMVTRSLSSSDSNISSTWSTPSTYSLDATDNTTSCTTADTTDCDSYTTPRMKCDATYGAWYNYSATTAGTVTTDSNSTNATQDICPAGWRLPTGSEQSGIISYSTAYNPVAGGYYLHGSRTGTTAGRWWASTVFATKAATARDALFWDGSTLFAVDGSRPGGRYVRCVLK